MLVGAVVLLAVALVGGRVIGLNPYVVLSGSMEPTYSVGDLIYVKTVDPDSVKVGDPITFVLNEDLVVATHRVVAVDGENRQFTTKGDANSTEDAAPVHFNNLIGVPVFAIPLLGYVSAYIQSPPGMYVAIAVGVILLAAVFLPDLFTKKDKKEEVREEAVQALMALGYSQTEALKAVRQVSMEEGITVEEVLKHALKYIGL